MATFKKTLSIDNRYRIEADFSEKPISSTDIANNISRVEYTLYLKRNYTQSGKYNLNEENPIKITIEGFVILNKKVSYDFRNSITSNTLATGIIAIQHDSNGMKTIQCSAYFKDVDNTIGSATASGSVQLTTLHKAPEPTITSIYEQDRYLRQLNLSNVFVANVSSKRFTLNANTYDSATIVGYKANNGDYSVETQSQYATLNFKLNPLTITDNKVPITITAIDSIGGIGKNTIYFDDYIPYFKPTLVQSNLKAKRDGQLTGKVKLIANGTYYNDSVGTQNIVPKVYYAYKEKGTQQYSNWLSATPTYSNGEWSIEENIGSDNPTDTNWFDPTLAYDIAIYVTDTLQEELTEQDNYVYETSVLIGESIMTKYKDKVDFKKITIKKVNPFETITGSLDSITKTGGNSNVTGTYSKCNNIVCYDLSITTTGSTAGGSNIFEGTITDFLPKIDTILTGYIGNRTIIGSLTTTGSLTIRNASDSSLGSGSNPSVRGTFII